MYLPRLHETAVELDRTPEPPRGSELILLVEDEPHVRAVASRALREGGYDVLEAGHGEEALQLAAALPERIAVLVTDVVMPRLGGKSLATQLTEARPGLRVLYLSGYTEDPGVVQGTTPPGSAFLQKPFTGAALLRKVREVLDAEGART